MRKKADDARDAILPIGEAGEPPHSANGGPVGTHANMNLKMHTAATSPDSQPMRKRAIRKAATRARLIDASCELFAEQGFIQTTIDQIVAEAGVSRASFYLHFASKEAIVGAIMERVGVILQCEYERLAGLGHASVEELAQWVAEFIATCRSNRPLLVVIQRTMPSDPGRFNETGYYLEMMALIGRQIPRFGDAAGPRDPRARADAMLFFFELLSVIYYLTQDGFDVDEPEICGAVARRLHRFIHE